MPSPKSSESPTIVKPTDPSSAHDADEADPGQVEQTKTAQREAKKGKYGSTPIQVHKKTEENKDKTHWIEVVLIDDEDAPVPGETVEIEGPDGTVSTRSTDAKGKVKVENLDPGSCKIRFPNLDAEAWEPA